MSLKKYSLLLLSVLLFQQHLISQEKDKKEKPEGLVIFKDTSVDYSGYLFEFKRNYSKRIFFKTTLYISNPTLHYVAFVADSIYVQTSDSRKTDVHTIHPLVVAPMHTIRYKLRFSGLNLNREQVHFTMHKALVSNEKLGHYEPFRIKGLPDHRTRVGNLEFEVLKVQHGNNGRHVRLRITNYKKEGLLGIDFSKIYVKLLTGEKVYNDIEDYHRMHQVKDIDLNLLVFRIAKGIKTDKYIYFDEVFAEYSLKELKDFKLDVLLNAEHQNADANSIEEKDKEDKSED